MEGRKARKYWRLLTSVRSCPPIYGLKGWQPVSRRDPEPRRFFSDPASVAGNNIYSDLLHKVQYSLLVLEFARSPCQLNGCQYNYWPSPIHSFGIWPTSWDTNDQWQRELMIMFHFCYNSRNNLPHWVQDTCCMTIIVQQLGDGCGSFLSLNFCAVLNTAYISPGTTGIPVTGSPSI